MKSIIIIFTFLIINNVFSQTDSNILWSNCEDAFNKKNYTEAINCYMDFLKSNPNNDTVIYKLALSYQNTGDYITAGRYLLKAIELNKDEIVYINILGLNYDYQKNYDSAIICFNKCLGKDPNYLNALFNRASSFQKTGDYRRCYEDALRCLDIDKEKVFEWLEESVQNKNNDTSYNNIGFFYSLAKNYKKAIENYNKAIEINPLCFTAYINRGIAYVLLSDYRRAIKDFDKAEKLDPKNPIVYTNRGIAYHNLMEEEQAIKDFNKAVQVAPNSREGYLERGLYFVLIEEYDKAIKDFEKIIKLFPEEEFGYVGRGIAYALLEEYENALEDFQKALKINPG